MKRRLSAILFYDVVGYSRLMHENEGATIERMKHSRIILEQRSNKAGNIGHTDKEHCILDLLKEHKLLGANEIERYGAGYRLRELYYSFHKTGKSLEDMGSSPGYNHLSDQETQQDKSEQLYNNVMRRLPVKYHALIQNICIHDCRNINHPRMINEALDALSVSMKGAASSI